MLSALTEWLARRRQIRRRFQHDARELVAVDERNAYYNAQRLAARARAEGRPDEFHHWTKVAAEVARISPCAEMDFTVVKERVDDELRARSRNLGRR